MIKRGLNKRAQITIFIIIALAILVIVFLIFINRGNLSTILSGKTPVQEIKECVEESLKEGVGIISVQGGSVNPQNYYLYQGNKVDYVCYTEEFYKTCVMQKPLLKQSIETELRDYIEPRVNNCMDSIKSSLENKGYSVSLKSPNISVELIPNNIVVNIDSDLILSKDTTESYKSIKTDYASELYDLVMIASSISNWESRYGDSETMNYMMNYPSLKVEKKKQIEGTTIYILTERTSGEKFVFASRSLALPAGIKE
jgi:hypothetical protein